MNSFFKRKIYILITTLNIHNSFDPQGNKTYVDLRKLGKHFQIGDLEKTFYVN